MPAASIWQSPRIRYSIIAGIIVSIGLLILWSAGLFQFARLRLNDIYFVPAKTSNNIVIVALDQDSLDRYGSTPSEWSRDVYAEMVNQLLSAAPRVLAFDLLFSETESEDETFAQALRDLRESDARTRIVLGSAGLNNVSAQSISDEPTFTFADNLSLTETVAEQADYLGFTNSLPDIDGIVRRQASLIQTNTDTGYVFSIATYLAYLRIPNIAADQVVRSDGLSLFVTPEREIKVDDFGFWQLYFYAPPATLQQSAFEIISFVDVIEGNFDSDLFDDKIVLVGLINNTALLDQYLVPSSINGALMAGVEIQANAIESLIQNSFPRPLSKGLEALLIVFLSFTTIIAYAYPRWYFKLVLLIVFALLWFIIASITFSATFMMISLFDTFLALLVPFIISLGIDITVERQEKQQKEFLLNSVQKIAEQRLRLEQAAQYILDDIKYIAPEHPGKLYLRQMGQAKGFIMFEPQLDDTLEKYAYTHIADSYDDLIQLHASSNHNHFPIRWQNQTHGLLIVSHKQKGQLNTQNRDRIAELMLQLAPHIDNLLLYNEVERQKSLLDAVIAESPASIAIVDDEAYIIQHNDDLSALFGDAMADLRGKSLSDLVENVSQETDLLAQLHAGFKKQELFHIDEIRVGELVVSLDAAPLENYGVWAVIIGDITSIVELSELKTQMLRIAAHDLKNPLGRIMGFAELLEMQLDLDERQGRYLSFIIKASNEMRDIITDILNLERLRSARLNFRPVDLIQLIQEVCGSHQPDVIQKQQHLTIDLPEQAVFVKADLAQLSQAVSNLVGNAIKYTPEEGNITIHLKLEDAQVSFTVEDTGYGIPEDAQEKLFTEFYRAKSEATSHIPGTGLGLSLVKSVIEAHDGEIGFTSQEAVGSTFYFSLPTVEMENDNAET